MYFFSYPALENMHLRSQIESDGAYNYIYNYNIQS